MLFLFDERETMKVSSEFANELVEQLQKNGVSKHNIKFIVRYGSSLYVRHYDDYDFKVFIKHRTEYTRNTISLEVQNIKVHCVFYTTSEWNDIMNERDQCVAAECNEMECVYGDDSEFTRYDVVNDKEVQEYLLNLFDIYFFNCTDEDFFLGEKRLWNFLLFAFKVKNNSNKLKWYQRHLINRAHDLKLDKEKFRPLFDSLKEKIL